MDTAPTHPLVFLGKVQLSPLLAVLPVLGKRHQQGCPLPLGSATQLVHDDAHTHTAMRVITWTAATIARSMLDVETLHRTATTVTRELLSPCTPTRRPHLLRSPGLPGLSQRPHLQLKGMDLRALLR